MPRLSLHLTLRAEVSANFQTPFLAHLQRHLLWEASTIIPDRDLSILSALWLLAHFPSRAWSSSFRADCVQGSAGDGEVD